MKSTLALTFFVFSLLSNSSVAATDGKVGDAITTKSTSTNFRAELKPGFHFNEQAPNLINIDGKNLKPAKFEKRLAVFNLPKQPFKNASASLYVCDDAKSFCEPIMVPIKSAEDGAAIASATSAMGAAMSGSVAGNATSAAAGEQANSTTSEKAAKVSRAVKINHHGFIDDNLGAAQEKAKKENKLILVDFAARWCPGCVRLEQEIFETSAFKKQSKDFVKVRLDFDRFENLSLGKEKYGIKFIPTLLVLNSDLEEVSRSVDFQPMSVIQPFLKEAKANPLPFAKLKEKSESGDTSAAHILGKRYYLAGRYDEAVQQLAKVEPAPIELLDARVQAAVLKDKTKKADFQQTVSAAIVAEPASSRSIVWRTLLVSSLDEKDEQRQKIAQVGIAVADDLLANETKILGAVRGDAIGEFTGYEKLLIASQRADLIEAAGLGEEAIQKARLKVTEVAKASKIPVTRTGPAMRYLIFLVGAKQWPEAETQARALLRREPKNPELQRRLLRVLNEQKKFDEAIKIGKEALPESYGKNEVWVVQQLAKAYRGGGKTQEAQALAQSYLARKDIDWSAMKSEEKDLKEIASASPASATK